MFHYSTKGLTIQDETEEWQVPRFIGSIIMYTKANPFLRTIAIMDSIHHAPGLNAMLSDANGGNAMPP